MFHLEADLHWIDTTTAGLGELTALLARGATPDPGKGADPMTASQGKCLIEALGVVETLGVVKSFGQTPTLWAGDSLMVPGDAAAAGPDDRPGQHALRVNPGEPFPADVGRPPPSRGLTNSILRAGSGPENPGKLGCARQTGAYQRRPRSSASSRAAWVGVISGCTPGWVRR